MASLRTAVVVRQMIIKVSGMGDSHGPKLGVRDVGPVDGGVNE